MIIDTEMCPGHVCIYSNPMGHTLKSFTSIEYEFGIRSKREGDSESGSGEVSEWFHYIMVGSGRARNPTGDIWQVLE
jgi:hypothetical protein